METILWQGKFYDGFLKITLGSEPDTVDYVFNGQDFFYSNHINVKAMPASTIVGYVFHDAIEGWNEWSIKAWMLVKESPDYVLH